MDDITRSVLEANRPSSDFPIPTIEGNFERIMHTMPGRMGPLVANDILLAIAEAQKNPALKEIVAIQQPFGRVAKHLSYWMSGLPLEVRNTIYSRLLEVGFIASRDKQHTLKNLMLLANKCASSWENMIYIFAEPVFDFLAKTSLDKKILETFEEIRNLKDSSEIVSLEAALREITEILINSMLRQNGLPTFSVLDETAYILGAYSLTGNIPDIFWSETEKNYSKRLAIRTHHLAIYDDLEIRPLTEQEFAEGRKKSGHNHPRPDAHKTLFKEITWPDEFLFALANDPSKASEIFDLLTFEDMISSVFKGINMSLPPADVRFKIQTADIANNVYCDGKTMLQACFDLSFDMRLPLAIQEFERADAYGHYQVLGAQIPGVTVTPLSSIDDLHFRRDPNIPGFTLLQSAASLRNRSEFPQYDFNLVCALPYLA